MNTTQQFYADCGEIILVSTSIEHTLGQHLTLFLRHHRPADPFIAVSVDKFADTSFNDKILLLERLCEENNIAKGTKTRLLNALQEIKRIRNKVGHWGAAYDPNKDQFRLEDRRIKKPNKDHLDANKAVKVVNRNYMIAYRELLEFYNEIFFPKTEQKR